MWNDDEPLAVLPGACTAPVTTIDAGGDQCAVHDQEMGLSSRTRCDPPGWLLYEWYTGSSFFVDVLYILVDSSVCETTYDMGDGYANDNYSHQYHS